MKIFKSFFVFTVVLFSILIMTSSLSAQILATAETGGKGNSAVMVSANGIFPEGLELANVYGQYVYGATSWLDVGPVVGSITALGRTQNYVGFGWNATLIRRSKAFVDVSFFGVATVPLSKRDEASTVFVVPAVVISRPIRVSGRAVSLYSGINTSVPIGNTQDKLFTPPEKTWNVPIGVSTSVSGKWLVYFETDIRNRVKAVGLCLVRVF